MYLLSKLNFVQYQALHILYVIQKTCNLEEELKELYAVDIDNDIEEWKDLPDDYKPDELDIEAGRTLYDNEGMFYINAESVGPPQMIFSADDDWKEVKAKENKPGWIDVLCDSGATCNLFKQGNGKATPAERPYARFGSGNVCAITHSCDSKFTTRQGTHVTFRTEVCPEATRNLISVSRMQKDGWKVTFDKEKCIDGAGRTVSELPPQQ